jgi:hypothetical protein
MMRSRTTMIATAIAFALALPIGALAQNSSTQDDNSGPAVVSPLQLPGTASAPQPQVPQPAPDQGVNWKGVGVGAGTVVGNVLYVPAKLVYGILGGIAGGAGWALTGGNTQVSNTIWRSSLGGDYVLTPNMVAGQDPIHFSGPMSTASQPSSLPQVDSSANGANTAIATGANPLPPPSHPTASSMGGVPAASGTHPMDSGAGPIGGSSSRSSSVSGPLPSTSIE